MKALYNQELSQELKAYQKDHVGLSDGMFAFDTFSGRPVAEVSYKQRAAQALLNGDNSTAQNLYNKAVTNDPTDGEAQIYAEDLRVKLSGTPYITIVLGLPLNNNPVNLGFTRPDLESAYEYQFLVNAHHLLPNNLKLCILVANTGDAASDDNMVGEVAQFIANRVKEGNPDTIVAVVGWPTTGATYNAISTLAAAHIPLVSQTASGVQLSGISPYFYRVNPMDDSQGRVLGQFAVQKLNAKKILVIWDPNDTYSQSLASSFASSVQQMGSRVIQDQLPLSGNQTPPPETVAQFQQGPIQNAVQNQVDLIFIAGYDQDAIRLAHALGNVTRLSPLSTYLTNLKILGGDAIDTSLILGQGTGPDAAIAQQYLPDMQRLNFTSFSDISERNDKRKSIFFSDWTALYRGMGNPPAITNDAIMTNDAFGVIADAITLVHGPFSGARIRDALVSIGTGSIPAYKGLSGQIHFSSNGDPIDKAVVVLRLTTEGDRNVVQFLSTAGQF
jgi:ABC-type branched-subunit amino acid transport system substrate-binding protein